jgi:hypothetical protein
MFSKGSQESLFISTHILSLPTLYLEFKFGSKFGMGEKTERSGKNAAFAVEPAIISPSTPDSTSLNTDHAENQGAGGMGRARHTCKRSRKGSGVLTSLSWD